MTKNRKINMKEINNKFEFIIKKFKEAITEWEKDLESLLATLKQKSNLSEWKQWLDEKMYEEDYEIQKNKKNIVDEFLPFIKSKSESSNKNRIIKDYLISLVNKTYQNINNPKLQHAYQDILVVQNFLRAELDIYENLEDSQKGNHDKDQIEDEDELDSSKSSNSL